MFAFLTGSLRAKLLSFFIIATLVMTVAVGAFSAVRVNAMLKSEVEQTYQELMRLLFDMVEEQHLALQEIGMEDIYKEKYQEELITELKNRYYEKQNLDVYPAIVDTAGHIVMHPSLETGSKKMASVEFIRRAIQEQNGIQQYRFGGEAKWMFFRTFEPWGWVVMYTVSVESQQASLQKFIWMLVGMLTILSLIIIAGAVGVVTSVTRSITEVTSKMQDIASGEGDLTQRMQVRNNDEIGRLAAAFNTFIQKLQGIIGNVAQNASSLNQASESLSAISSQIAQNADQTNNEAQTVASSTQQTAAGVRSVSAATEQMSASINNVSAAIEELSVSLNEVAANCQKESQVAADATTQAKETFTLMQKLDASVHQVGKITDMITDIADQTNLLALNATIEAASAGDAGKGFAVVASEVKELAKQTAQATREISEQISEMQINAQGAVGAIEKISNIIEEINGISQTIVSAVEEQSATVNEVAKNTAGANDAAANVAQSLSGSSQNLNGVAEAVQRVSAASSDTAQGVSKVAGNINDLAALTGKLQEIVTQFKI